MARGNTRDKARLKNMKKEAKKGKGKSEGGTVKRQATDAEIMREK